MSVEAEAKPANDGDAGPSSMQDAAPLDAASVGDLTNAYQATLKALTVQVGIAIQARTRLAAVLSSLRARQQTAQATSTSFRVRDEEVAFLQNCGIVINRRGSAEMEAGLDSLDVSRVVVNQTQIKQLLVQHEAVRQMLARAMREARARFEAQSIAMAQQEAERIAKQQQQQEQNAEVNAASDGQAATVSQEAEKSSGSRSKKDDGKLLGDAIVLDDDDDDDDTPLAASKPGEASANAKQTIDLTSPSGKPGNTNPPAQNEAGIPTNPAALLASLGVSGGALSEALAAVVQPSDQTAKTTTGNETMNLGSFDFNAFGLGNMATSGAPSLSGGANALDGLDFSNMASGGDADIFGDSLLTFNNDQVDGVDLSFLSKLDGSGSGSDNNLLGNIDFSALLGNDGGG
jgi:hypothetical protein